jgi:hypothetical protein
MAIPASAVLLVTVGGVLAYAGFTNRNPLEALRELSTGKPAVPRNTSGIDPEEYSSTAKRYSGDIPTDIIAGEGIPALPHAVARFSGDKYSQLKRWQNGYSDCSSFVGKGLKSLGVKPPGPSTTTAYLSSKDWKRIPSSDARSGDVAVSLNHMVVYTTNSRGIGQQNPRSNVKRGAVKDLMVGNTPYVTLRFVGGTAKPKTDPPSSAT